MENIRISVEDISITAELLDTPTAQKIIQSLPLEASVNTWGDEIYFDVPLNLELEPGARADVEVGELGYWPSGPAFCIFFGPTPMSTGEKPRAASEVNIFGRVIGDSTILKSVRRGATISITEAD
ncbi:MAG: hypothetical protein HOC20_08240 [Chloroflexi bacterium]|nr:hypothetical protein [Chloroflexota bacterium]